ncbi:unnamed protein product, partial [Symbiodinium pilosum]
MAEPTAAQQEDMRPWKRPYVSEDRRAMWPFGRMPDVVSVPATPAQASCEQVPPEAIPERASPLSGFLSSQTVPETPMPTRKEPGQWTPSPPVKRKGVGFTFAPLKEGAQRNYKAELRNFLAWRKYHDGRTAQARPEVYSAEKLAEDKFQSTVTIPPMGPRVYQGEVRERQNLAEQSAAKAFFEHPDNQYELENLASKQSTVLEVPAKKPKKASDVQAPEPSADLEDPTTGASDFVGSRTPEMM